MTMMVTIMTMTVMMMTVIHYSDAGYFFIMLQCNISQGPSVSNAATISKPLVRKYITQRRDLAAELAAGMHPLVRWLTPPRQRGCLLVSAGVFPSSRQSSRPSSAKSIVRIFQFVHRMTFAVFDAGIASKTQGSFVESVLTFAGPL